jgi:hypothetical protein
VALRAAYLTSVPPLEVRLVAAVMLMLLRRQRLLRKLLVRSAPVLKARATLEPDLVARLRASLVMESRPVLVRLAKLVLARREALVARLALLGTLE